MSKTKNMPYKNMAYYKALHGISEKYSPFKVDEGKASLFAGRKKLPGGQNEYTTPTYEFKGNVSKNLLSGGSFRGGYGREYNLQATGNVSAFKPTFGQTNTFRKSRDFAMGNHPHASNRQAGLGLFTDKERADFNRLKNVSEIPANQKISAGLDFKIKTTSNVGGSGFNKYSFGAGGTLKRTGAHRKGKDAGFQDITKTSDATSQYQMPDGTTYRTPSFSNTIGRGDTEYFTNYTAGTIGGSGGGLSGTTSSGQSIFFGGTGKATQAHKDLFAQYGETEKRENMGYKTYKLKQAKTKFKPYVQGSFETGFRPYRGATNYSLKLGAGTKYAPNAGFNIEAKAEGSRYSKFPGLYGSVGYGTNTGTGVTIGYKFGKNKKR